MSNATDVSANQLLAIVERAERMRAERRALGEDQSELFKEAKANGFDVPALKALLKEREEDPNRRAEAEAILDLYRQRMNEAERQQRRAAA